MSERVELFVDHLFRHQAGQMIATLTRLFGLERLDQVEDAVQDALVLALRQWPYEPIPANPRAWLIEVAKNRMIDRIRRDRRSASEDQIPESAFVSPNNLTDSSASFTREMTDDQLRMIFTCCHPSLTQDSQVALTLKTIGGFSAHEIARAFLATEAAITKMLVRARQRLREHRAHLEMPPPEKLEARLDSALQVVYLMFNEGYAAHEGEALVRKDLCYEAIRLCELLAAHPVSDTPKTHALTALLSFQGARLKARSSERGELMVLSAQNRSLWDSSLLRRGLHHLRLSASGDELSDYHIEAEIASCHALATNFESTDWARVLACYEELYRRKRSPVVALNRLIALAQVEGPEAGLQEIDLLKENRALQSYYPFFVTHAELLLDTGRQREAIARFQRAMEMTSSEPVRAFIRTRILAAQHQLSAATAVS